jgi:hypothetical protein
MRRPKPSQINPELHNVRPLAANRRRRATQYIIRTKRFTRCNAILAEASPEPAEYLDALEDIREK